ncbi:hypothetical protein AOQ84DRAFT_364022 [Glonium stellatum]|uniref:Uncharacterized protein n=1 Tax=Glonium stellatum TaxID=574774 RepID=A0A8E2F1J2_9PEZI|nr:hypothetical protein AOQ84DRAFT_364022 [Glonium stellatum]
MMLDQDVELGVGVLEALIEYYAKVDSRVLEDPTETNDHVEHRHEDWASMPNITNLFDNVNPLNGPELALLLFALDIHLSQAAIAQMQPSIDNAMIAAALANEYYSYDKEVQQCRGKNFRLFNAATLALRASGPVPNCFEARQNVKALSLYFEAQLKDAYRLSWAVWLMRNTRGRNKTELYEEEEMTMRPTHDLAYFVAGNNPWCSRCPRCRALEPGGNIYEQAENSAATSEHRRIRSNRLEKILV